MDADDAKGTAIEASAKVKQRDKWTRRRSGGKYTPSIGTVGNFYFEEGVPSECRALHCGRVATDRRCWFLFLDAVKW
jgi:hypothetical protein